MSFLKREKRSFGYAFKGLFKALKSEPHLKFHLLMAALVLLLAWILSVSIIEWCMLILCIGSVITAELINTAIESTIDRISCEQHPLSAKAKDIAAAAVLIISFTAAIVGLLIFVPYGWRWIEREPYFNLTTCFTPLTEATFLMI